VNDLAPQVAEAVVDVRAHFAGKPVEVVPDGAGGALVTIRDIPVGRVYTPDTTWLGFHLNAAYPDSDVYPHYCGLLARADGQAHGAGISAATWRDDPALQLSRRSTGWNPAVDTATIKAQKVITWLIGL
jgi:hypothetical protein